jgi:adsorption protein B
LVTPVTAAIASFDATIAALLFPVAVWIVLSGLDDLFLFSAWVVSRLRRPEAPPNAEQLLALPEKRVAVFVPLWLEAEVIGDMLEHNMAAIRYRNYHFFIGVYPNDSATAEAVRNVQQRFSSVTLCECPHDGPTSKADCLNWIYQHMLLYEETKGDRFDIILTHDAEDLIHPEELHWLNYYCDRYGMVQTPVLPLPTPAREFTHGFYCDDFAEFHGKDLPARHFLGGFIPSSGVGTGYRRDAIEALASADSGRVFQPHCLTEDYENGLRLHLLGVRQIFVPLVFRERQPVATRAFFPRTFPAARRQRTRWVTGIALQAWQHHGWGRGWRTAYWLWRDRKGLIGNPLSVLSNAVFLYGFIGWIHSATAGVPWLLGEQISRSLPAWLPPMAAALAVSQLAARIYFSARVFGAGFALLAPLRSVFGNLLNSAATAGALYQFARSRISGVPLVWFKTEHAYPNLAALRSHKRPLGEILVASGYLSQEQLNAALATKPEEMLLGQHLVETGWLSEADLYQAMSLQHSLPAIEIEPVEIDRSVARLLPARIVHGLQVIPIGVKGGCLYLATPQIPTEEIHAEIARFTRLGLRFSLVTPANFRQLCAELL